MIQKLWNDKPAEFTVTAGETEYVVSKVNKYATLEFGEEKRLFVEILAEVEGFEVPVCVCYESNTDKLYFAQRVELDSLIELNDTVILAKLVELTVNDVEPSSLNIKQFGWELNSDLLWNSDFNGDEVGYDDVNVAGCYSLRNTGITMYLDVETGDILELWNDDVNEEETENG